MIDVYVSSTVHKGWNIPFNLRLCETLEARGLKCYLPQRDTNQEGAPNGIFDENMEGIKKSHTVLCVAENESINVGAEIGFAYGAGKKVIALTSNNHTIPLMVRFMIAAVIEVENLDTIEDYIDDIITQIRK